MSAGSASPRKVLGIAGWKNSGKTTLTERLVGELTGRGLRLATLKHAHHAFDIDHPGTDSHRHRLAGAREVGIVSGRRWAIVHEIAAGEAEPSLEVMLARLGPADLVLVEGFKQAPIPKFEVRRRAGQPGPLLAATDPLVLAIAADHDIPEARVPVLPLDAIGTLADLALQSLGLGT